MLRTVVIQAREALPNGDARNVEVTLSIGPNDQVACATIESEGAEQTG